MGRSRGGASAKPHVAVDAPGGPLRVRLTPGRRHETTQADAPTEGFAAGLVIGDAAFGADPFRARTAARGAAAVVPSNPSRPAKAGHDGHLCRERHPVGCLFAEIERFRRVAARYEETARNLLAVINLARATIRSR